MAAAGADKAALEREKALAEEYAPLLRALLEPRGELQLAAVYAVQLHAHRQRCPRGLLLRWFMYLCNLEVCKDDAFLRWCGDVADACPGRGEALFRVNTLLKWAVRQGHLEAAVLLMRSGADPALRDAEGCASLHLSLSAMGASPQPTDCGHGNMALHWAVLARNTTAISTLVLYGNASLDVPNLRGTTPLAMLQSNADALWVGSKVADKIKECAALASKRSVFRRLAYDGGFRWWCVLSVPFLAFYLTGLVPEAEDHKSCEGRAIAPLVQTAGNYGADEGTCTPGSTRAKEAGRKRQSSLGAALAALVALLSLLLVALVALLVLMLTALIALVALLLAVLVALLALFLVALVALLMLLLTALIALVALLLAALVALLALLLVALFVLLLNTLIALVALLLAALVALLALLLVALDAVLVLTALITLVALLLAVLVALLALLLAALVALLVLLLAALMAPLLVALLLTVIVALLQAEQLFLQAKASESERKLLFICLWCYRV